MKKLISILLAGITLLFAAGCVETIPSVVEELQLGRCFSPTNITAAVKNGEYIVFNWDKSKAAAEYVVELYDNAKCEGTPLKTISISKADVPYTAHVEADMTYYFRVKAMSDNADIKESNWSYYEKELLTSAIKSSLDPQLVDRTSNSISIKWKADPEVDHIRVTPAVDGTSEYTRVEVTADDATAGAKVVEGLKSSVNYTLTVHFKSADRGSVTAWTRPDATGFVAVKDTAELKQAIKDAASKIQIPFADTTWIVGEMALSGPLNLIGQESTDGTKTVLAGRFTMNDPSAVGSIHCEGLKLSGAAESSMSQQTHVVTANNGGTMTEMSFLNCQIEGYQRGLYYDNKGVSVQNIVYDNCIISNIGYDGGDCFDIRQDGTLGTVSFTNNTFNQGARTFVRIDKAATTNFVFKNNTVNALCTAVQSNNNGLFHIRGAVTSFILSNNLFLNEKGASGVTYCQLISHNTAAVKPTEISKNYFYNCEDNFFTHTVDAAEDFGKEKAIANGGADLAKDPCVDSGAENFYVTDAAVKENNIGDPRWFGTAPEPTPEDLTQNVTKPIHTWDFSNGKLFYKQADKDMVRDGIRFYVKKDFITFDAKGPVFTAKATVASGIPTDCGMSIKVDQAGSVVVSTAAAGDDQATLIVNVDGKPKEAVTVGVENKKITFADFEPGSEHMIYLYGTAPIQITYLQWNDDVEVGNKKLDTPVVTADKASVNQGDDVSVKLDWEAINKAGSYDIVVNKVKKANVTDVTYSLATKSMEAGDYEIGVVALPASTDKTREASDTCFVKLSIVEVLKPITEKTVWAADYFNKMIARWGSGVEVKTAFVAGNLGYVPGSSKFKFAVDNADDPVKAAPRVQTGGAGEAGTKSCLQIMAGGNGKLTILVRSSGAAGRFVKIANGTTVIDDTYEAPAKELDPGEKSYDIKANSGDIINIFGTGAINFYSITWEPQDAPAGKDYVWDFSATEWTTKLAEFTKNTNYSDWDFTINDLSVISGGATMKWNTTGDLTYIQPGGKSNGANRYFTFTTETSGTLKIWVTNTGDSEDLTRMCTVKVGDGAEDSQAGGYAKNTGPHELTFTIDAGVVKFYPTVNGLIFYKATFTHK